jgi:hypothetical protein
MNFKRIMTTSAVGLSLIAAQVGPLATQASADRGYRGGSEYGRSAHRGGEFRRHYAPPQAYHRPYRRHRNDAGKAIAIGIGALMLGIIASQAGRDHRDHSYD